MRHLPASLDERTGRGGYSIPGQREACLKYIRENGWTFVDEYSDRGESARSQDFPQLQVRMLARIKKDKDVQAVVVHKIDRLARNMEDHVAIKAILKRAKAALVSVGREYGLRKARGGHSCPHGGVLQRQPRR